MIGSWVVTGPEFSNRSRRLREVYGGEDNDK